MLKSLLATAVLAALLAGCGGGDEAPTAESTAAQAPAGEAPAPAAEPPAEGEAPAAAAEPAAEGDRPYELRKRLMDSTTQQDEWVPDLAATPGESPTETLRRADDAVLAGRLEQGEDNALSLYLRVLENDPKNAEAKAGIDKVVAELVTRGEEALTQARFNEASRLAGVVSKARPDDEAVKAFKTKVDAGREVGLILGEAQRLIAAGKIVAPDGDNAAALYRDILRKDPANAAAKQGLDKIETDLIARASAAAESGNYAESEQLLADAGKARPGSQAVQNASSKIVEMRSGRTDQLMQEANAAIAAKDLAKANEVLAQIEQVSAQAEGIDELRARIESAKNYDSYKPGQLVSDKLSSGANGPELVVLPMGSFQMGSPESEADRKSNEGPRHEVTIRKGIAMARNETTVGQYRRFVTATGYVATSVKTGSSTIYNERNGSMAESKGATWESSHSGERANEELPVVHVSWNDAKAYVDWLAKETGKRYRLPSESEFEYAMRAGSQSRYPWGEGDPSRVVANLTGEDDRSASGRNWVNAFEDYDDGFWGAAPVRTFEANAFGLHDMSGNVSEWVDDCWHENYQRAPNDGTAWVNEGCNRRVIRGASWASSPDQARSALRIPAGPATTNARVGFRVVRDL